MKIIKSSGKAFGLLFGTEVHILAPSSSCFAVKKDGEQLEHYFCLCNSHRCAEECREDELHEIVDTAKELGATRIILRAGEENIEMRWKEDLERGRFTRRQEWPQFGPISIHGLPVTCIAKYTERLHGDKLKLDEHYKILC